MGTFAGYMITMGLNLFLPLEIYRIEDYIGTYKADVAIFDWSQVFSALFASSERLRYSIRKFKS